MIDDPVQAARFGTDPDTVPAVDGNGNYRIVRQPILHCQRSDEGSLNDVEALLRAYQNFARRRLLDAGDHFSRKHQLPLFRVWKPALVFQQAAVSAHPQASISIDNQRADGVGEGFASREISFNPQTIKVIQSVVPGADPYASAAVLGKGADGRLAQRSRQSHAAELTLMQPEQALPPRAQPQIAPRIAQHSGCKALRQAFRLSVRNQRRAAPTAQPSAQHADPQIAFVILKQAANKIV